MKYVPSRNVIHFLIWGTFTILSNIGVSWSKFFKPIQRAAAVSATKKYFTPSDSNLQKTFSRYGATTKASLELSGIVECSYKHHKDIFKTAQCYSTVTIKYSATFICDVLTIDKGPSYITKPLCFAYGTLTSQSFKSNLHNTNENTNEIEVTAIAAAIRALEHWLPKYLNSHLYIPFDFTFYITTSLEALLSYLHEKFSKETTPSIDTKLGNASSQRLQCTNEPFKVMSNFTSDKPNNTCLPLFQEIIGYNASCDYNKCYLGE